MALTLVASTALARGAFLTAGGEGRHWRSGGGLNASGSGWTCGNSGQTVTCTVSSLSVGAAPAIQIVATAPVTPGLVLTNTAVVNAATHPNTPVNSNSVSVKVQFRAFLPIVRRP